LVPFAEVFNAGSALPEEGLKLSTNLVMHSIRSGRPVRRERVSSTSERTLVDETIPYITALPGNSKEFQAQAELLPSR
jgi:hypothetical protein